MPIIAVTTAAEPGAVKLYLASGMTGVVPKPINATQLADTLSAAFAQARRDAQPNRRKTAAPRAASA